MENIELKRELIILDGMANTLLKQMKDIKVKVRDLGKYSPDEVDMNMDKIIEIGDKLIQVKRIIDGKI